MDPVPLYLAGTRFLQGCRPPHPPHTIAGVPKAVMAPEAEGLWLKDSGHMAPGEPKGVRAQL